MGEFFGNGCLVDLIYHSGSYFWDDYFLDKWLILKGLHLRWLLSWNDNF